MLYIFYLILKLIPTIIQHGKYYVEPYEIDYVWPSFFLPTKKGDFIWFHLTLFLPCHGWGSELTTHVKGHSVSNIAGIQVCFISKPRLFSSSSILLNRWFSDLFVCTNPLASGEKADCNSVVLGTCNCLWPVVPVTLSTGSCPCVLTGTEGSHAGFGSRQSQDQILPSTLSKCPPETVTQMAGRHKDHAEC